MNSTVFEMQAGPVAFNTWLANMGVTPITGWRWEKRGWITTVNIAGRKYITPQAIREFNERATRGEFAKEIKRPHRGSTCAKG